MEALDTYRRIKTIDGVSFEGKRVFIRVDFNVPLTPEGKVADDARIRAPLDTIREICDAGGKIALASHLGRPGGKIDPKLSMMPVAEVLADTCKCDIIVSDDCMGDGVRKVMAEMKQGELLLLENLRFHRGEEENDDHFAKRLAANFDVYVNDAFASVHRAHASTVGMVSYFSEKYAGRLIHRELKYLSGLLSGVKHPFIVVLGGAKVSDKIGVIETLLQKCDTILIGGAMAYTFLKAKGVEVGASLVETSKLITAERILKLTSQFDVKLVLPVDHVIAERGTPDDSPHEVTDGVDIPAGMKGLDIGPKTINLFNEHIKGASVVFWNGPMGMYELEPFAEGTYAIARAIANTSARTIAGGADTVSAIHRHGLESKIDHVSTGGGATLEFLEGRPLPGLAALAK